jgi:hypothetical protein
LGVEVRFTRIIAVLDGTGYWIEKQLDHVGKDDSPSRKREASKKRTDRAD